MGGIAGGAISSVGFGLVGAMAYLFPFVFFGAVAFYISNKGNPHAYIKVGAQLFWSFSFVEFRIDVSSIYCRDIYFILLQRFQC